MADPATGNPAADRNLLFGVLALQADLIDANRFAEACTAWSARKQVPLADLLVERGWLTPEERDGVEQFLQRKLKKNAGDVRASLNEVLSERVRQTLSNVGDPLIHHTLSEISRSEHGAREQATVHYQPAGRERYTLTRLHARGGIGRVWLARDDDLGREVALKELLDDRNDEPAIVARFVEEAQITGQLQHPNIVPVYELARPADRSAGPFYTMRFVRGRTLAAAIQQYHAKRRAAEAGTLELRELLGHFLAVSNAVAYAHSRGVLHRDLKPGNVVVGDFGEVIVLDWGLAKLKDSSDTQTSLLPVSVRKEPSRGGTAQGQVIGTPSYMPPEQAEGRTDLFDERSDVYGLGAVLYEVLTGEPPFDGPEAAEILARVVADDPEPPRRRVPGTPAALEAVCLKALAKRPADRYPSAREMADEIQRWLADEPVTVYRERLPARAGRWVKRHRVLVTSGAAATLVAALALGVTAAVLSAANERLAASNRREQDARAAAEANYRLTRAAVDEYFTKVSENRLLHEPGLEPLRQELLESARVYYMRFVEQRGDDPNVRTELGLALHRLALITGKIDSLPKALEFVRQAVAIQRNLVEQHPDRLEHQAYLAESMGTLGDLLRLTGELKPSEEALQEAVHLQEELVRARPGEHSYELQLAELRQFLMNTYMAMGRFTDAEAVAQPALRLREKLVEADPNNADARYSLAFGRLTLANIHGRTGQFARSLGEYQTALADVRQIRAARPEVAQYQALEGNLLDSIGLRYNLTGQFKEAETYINASIALQERLVRDHPKVADYQRNLAEYYTRLGINCWNLKRFDDSLAAYRQALPIRERQAREQATVIRYQADLARLWQNMAVSYQDSGQAARAEDAYRKAVAGTESVSRANPSNPRYLRDWAASVRTLGCLFTDIDKQANAEESFLQAIALHQQLVQAHPDHVDYRMGLGQTYENLASVRLQTRAWPAALQAADDAVRELELVLKQAPDHGESRSDLARAQDDRARVFVQLGRFDDALKAWDRAVALAPEGERTQLALRRWRAAAARGRFAGLRSEVQAILDKPTCDDDLRYEAAGVYATAARPAAEHADADRQKEAEEFARASLGLLAKLNADGYFKRIDRVTDFRHQAAFDSLKSREEFRKFLAELEAGVREKGK